jgi:3-deoxy-D-manno-octulosonic-acid transferase
MNLYDIAYAIGGGIAAPVWLAKPSARRKVFNALSSRMGHVAVRESGGVGVMIHAVSLGEINATRELVHRLRAARPDSLHFTLTTTTDTGFARGQELYGGERDVTLMRFPLDFSWAMNRLIASQRPAVAALMELEVWPNFLRQCRRHRVPVVLINGRLTTASFGRYRLIRPLARAMFSQIQRVCAQDAIYAQRFIDLGVDPQRVDVTGTMKFDTAPVADRVDGAAELAAEMSIGDGPIWVCGSTGPGEEPIILDQYRELLPAFPKLRLVLVPRKPERFDEVAQQITAAGFACSRRTKPSLDSSAVLLGDTMGELRKWYSLADVVFVGRTLVDLGPRQHGSDMIEPAALAKPVIVGPFTGNFAEPMARFLADKAIMVVQGGEELTPQVADLLNHPDQAAALGARARQVVLREQGATDRHVKAILELIGDRA